MAIPLLRFGVWHGLRTWRGGLLGSAVVAVLLVGDAVHIYHNPPGCQNGVCQKDHAIREAEALTAAAGGVVVVTAVGIAALRAGRRFDLRSL